MSVNLNEIGSQKVKSVANGEVSFHEIISCLYIFTNSTHTSFEVINTNLSERLSAIPFILS